MSNRGFLGSSLGGRDLGGCRAGRSALRRLAVESNAVDTEITLIFAIALVLVFVWWIDDGYICSSTTLIVLDDRPALATF